MFTQCPSCDTVYSLSPADLRAAGGYVRCGNCDTTFSALSRLQDTPPIDGDDPPRTGDDGVASPELPGQGQTTRRLTGENLADASETGSGEDAEGNADTQVLDERWADELDEFDEDLDDAADWFEPEDTPKPGQATTRLHFEDEPAAADGDDYFSHTESRSKPADPGQSDADAGALAEPEPEPEPDPEQEQESVPETTSQTESDTDPSGAPIAAATDESADPGHVESPQDEPVRSNSLGFRDTLLPDEDIFTEISDDGTPAAPESDSDASLAATTPETARSDETEDTPKPSPADSSESTTGETDPPREADPIAAAAADATTPPGTTADDNDGESPIAPLSWEDMEQPVDDAEDRRDILNYLRPGLSTGQKIGGSVLGLLMVGVLFAQLIHHWRAELVLNEQYGHLIQTAYQRLGLTVVPATSYRDYEVARHTIVPDASDVTQIYQFRATIYNRANGRRPYPAVRLTFQDRFGDEGYARTFAPDEYIEATATDDVWLASGAAVEIALELVDLAPERSTNYYVEACAPLPAGRVTCAPITRR